MEVRAAAAQVRGFTNMGANKMMFDCEGTQKSVAGYFEEKYQKWRPPLRPRRPRLRMFQPLCSCTPGLYSSVGIRNGA